MSIGNMKKLLGMGLVAGATLAAGAAQANRLEWTEYDGIRCQVSDTSPPHMGGQGFWAVNRGAFCPIDIPMQYWDPAYRPMTYNDLWVHYNNQGAANGLYCDPYFVINGVISIAPRKTSSAVGDGTFYWPNPFNGVDLTTGNPTANIRCYLPNSNYYSGLEQYQTSWAYPNRN